MRWPSPRSHALPQPLTDCAAAHWRDGRRHRPERGSQVHSNGLKLLSAHSGQPCADEVLVHGTQSMAPMRPFQPLCARSPSPRASARICC